MRTLLASIMIMTSSSALAEPVKLAGLTMEMTLDQQQQVLINAGYKCGERKLILNIKELVCAKDKKEIRPSEKKVRINCHTFNACSLSYQELAQEIVDQGVLQKMEYDPKFVKAIDGSQVLVEQFCGRAEQGERVCVIADKNLLGEVLVTVTLEKGSFGQGSVTFN